MASETLAENGKTLDLLDIQPNDHILEIGFGHGRTLQRAVQYVPDGSLAGVDFSNVMLRHAMRRNRASIEQGKMRLYLADSSEMPDRLGTFTKVFSVHTIYFWEDPSAHFSEIFRVLKPGGRFVLGYRSIQDKRATLSFPSEVYSFPTVQTVECDMRNAGFAEVTTVTEQLGSRLMHWTIAGKA